MPAALGVGVRVIVLWTPTNRIFRCAGDGDPRFNRGTIIAGPLDASQVGTSDTRERGYEPQPGTWWEVSLPAGDFAVNEKCLQPIDGDPDLADETDETEPLECTT